MELAEYCTVFNYRPPRPQKGVNFKYREIVSGIGVKTKPKLILPGELRGKFGKEPPFPQMS